LDDLQLINSLVRRCVEGDAHAWEQLVSLFNRRIYNICYRFTGSADDAEDLTQEVFIRVYRTVGSYEVGKGAFNTWITTMARNLLVDHFRRKRQDRLTDSLDAPTSQDDDSIALGDRMADSAPSAQQRVESGEKQALVHAALQKLSPELREAVILRDLQDMDYREIAQALRVPEGTVKSRINRGRAELARVLARIYPQSRTSGQSRPESGNR
jgi:RNA polymerase sigma-70 factor (ECF subfamily)